MPSGLLVGELDRGVGRQVRRADQPACFGSPEHVAQAHVVRQFGLRQRVDRRRRPRTPSPATRVGQAELLQVHVFGTPTVQLQDDRPSALVTIEARSADCSRARLPTPIGRARDGDRNYRVGEDLPSPIWNGSDPPAAPPPAERLDRAAWYAPEMTSALVAAARVVRTSGARAQPTELSIRAEARRLRARRPASRGIVRDIGFSTPHRTPGPASASAITEQAFSGGAIRAEHRVGPSCRTSGAAVSVFEARATSEARSSAGVGAKRARPTARCPSSAPSA
jgi:hypothetical protein